MSSKQRVVKEKYIWLDMVSGFLALIAIIEIIAGVIMIIDLTQGGSINGFIICGVFSSAIIMLAFAGMVKVQIDQEEDLRIIISLLTPKDEKRTDEVVKDDH